MKISCSKCEAGNVLFFVIIILAAAITVIASYLSLASNRSIVATRSTAWNTALTVAEAGVEEGLTQVQWSLVPSNSGWTQVGSSSVYTRTRTTPFGDNSAYYTATIIATNPPTITATGYVLVPVKGTYIHRTVQVTTKSPGKFPYGMLSKGAITMSGGSVVDSFDSSNPAYSTNGMYSPNQAESNCRVYSASGGANTIQVGTAKVYGYVDTAPGSGTITVGSSGAVGDASYVNNSLNGGTIQTGHSNDDVNVDIPDVTVPYTSGAAVPTGITNIFGTNYNYVLGSNSYYYSGSFTISDSAHPMIVTNKATLYVTGDFTVQGSGYIYIATNGSLALYVGTTNASGNGKITISGSGVANGSQSSANLSINALPSVKTVTYSGSSKFIGSLYAPSADLTMSGSADASGAVVAGTITLSGGMNFHYDEALGGTGYPTYTITSWTEL